MKKIKTIIFLIFTAIFYTFCCVSLSYIICTILINQFSSQGVDSQLFHSMNLLVSIAMLVIILYVFFSLYRDACKREEKALSFLECKDVKLFLGDKEKDCKQSYSSLKKYLEDGSEEDMTMESFEIYYQVEDQIELYNFKSQMEEVEALPIYNAAKYVFSIVIGFLLGTKIIDLNRLEEISQTESGILISVFLSFAIFAITIILFYHFLYLFGQSLKEYSKPIEDELLWLRNYLKRSLIVKGYNPTIIK